MEDELMSNLFDQTNRGQTLAAAAFLLFGLLLVCFPAAAGSVICYLLAAALVADAVRHIVHYVRDAVSLRLYRYDLALGVCEALLGLFIFIRPQLLLSFLPACLGLTLLVSGVVRLQRALDLRRAGFRAWTTILVLGLVVTALGALMLFNPFATAKTLLSFIGVSMLINAACLLWTGHCARKLLS